MTDREFMASLTDTSIDPAAFNHTGHLRAAYLVLTEEPTFGRALDRIAALIKAFAAKHGKTDLYHETITVAFVSLINARIKGVGDGGGWDGFAAANSDLFERPALGVFYPEETLAAPLAKRVFLLPGMR